MKHARNYEGLREACEIIDFEEALLGALAPDVLSDVITEAQILAAAFAPDGGRGALERVAMALWSGAHDAEMDRAHARRLAAAIRRLAKTTRG